jgi:putative ABC transport system permease protein
VDQIGQDLRVAARGFRRTPTFAVTVVLILALGIGMAAAMWAVCDAVLLRPLPIQDQDRVVAMWTYRDPTVELGLQGSDIEAMQGTMRTMRDIASVAHWGAFGSPLLDGDRSLVLNRGLVGGNFFEVLGARPVIGRLLRAADTPRGGDGAHVMVLSYAAWKRHFGGDSAVVGRTVTEAFTRWTYTIVGVAPPGLDYPTGVELWMPLWGPGVSVTAVARLAPGATAAMAQQEMFTTVKARKPELLLTGATAFPFVRAVVGDVRPVLVLLTAAVALLLALACVNVGNLLLLRAAGRGREIAIRRALGASYGAVARQLLTESAMLGIAGGALGLACAHGLVRLLLAYAPPQLPRTDVIRLAGPSLGATAALTVAALLLFGLAPALAAARGGTSIIGLGARSGSDTRGRRRVRHLLVGSQVAFALVMLAGAGLLVRSLARMQTMPLGYAPERLSILLSSWPGPKYPTSDKLVPIGEQVIQRWRAVPGVVAVTPILVPPFLGPNVFTGKLVVEGYASDDPQGGAMVPAEAGGPDYFRTFGIPLRRGRGFTDADGAEAPFVAVVSETIANRYWPNQDPIGKRIKFWSRDSTKYRTIVGVAGDIHYRDLRAATPSIYMPWLQADGFQAEFAIRTRGDLAAVLPALKREMRAVEPQLDIWQATPMQELMAAPLARPRLGAFLLSSFGLVAVGLAALGLYGVMAALVREQTREIGVRLALGATPGRVRRDVLGRALRVTAAGGAVGLAGALASARLFTALLFEVSPADPIALAAAVLLLGSVAFAAAYFPARRATKVDPAEALRAD